MRSLRHLTDDHASGDSGSRDTRFAGSVVPVMSVLAQDPTGLSSPVGRLVVLLWLLAALVVLARWWWYNRRR
jgi:hypothetical protein